MMAELWPWLSEKQADEIRARISERQTKPQSGSVNNHDIIRDITILDWTLGLNRSHLTDWTMIPVKILIEGSSVQDVGYRIFSSEIALEKRG